MNVLLTCAGRRRYLVQYFREALAGRGVVLGADASPDAPAMAEVDRAFVVPPVSDPRYVETILRICAQQDVRLVLSLNDLELPILASAKQRFLNARVIPVVSDPRVIEIGFDKRRTHEFLQQSGVKVPRQYLTLNDARIALTRGELRFPLVVKPRWGTASIGIDFPEDDRELELSYNLARYRLQRSILDSVSSSDWDHSLLIQEKLSGHEYGMDIVNDLDGNYVVTFVKRKMAMRAGETDRALVVDEPELVALGERVGRALGHVANLDCDVFLTRDGPYVLELNPRFGGGYPFSHEAGANIPRALLAWAEGKQPDPAWFQTSAGWSGAKCDMIVANGHDQAHSGVAA